MGKKKRNNLKRIEKNSNFNSTRQRPPTHTNNEIPGEEIIFILEAESPELSDEELEIIQSMPGVYFRPMKIFKKGKIMIGYIQETQLFQMILSDAKNYAELIRLAKETEDYEALERYRDEVLTLKTPFNIVLNMINDALQGEAA